MIISKLPKIAILLAAYNGVKWIEEQIDSLLGQSGVNVTIYISIDTSTDGTREYLESIYLTNSRIVILKDIDRFGGAAKNFYRLFRDVNFNNFDYISLSDQDDIWNKDKMINACTKIQDNNCAGYSSNVLAFWENGKTMLIEKAQKQTAYDYMFEAAGPGCTYVLTRELAIKFKNMLIDKWQESNKIALHDWLIYAYSRESGYKWYIDKKSGMRYRQHAINVIGANSGMDAKIKRFKLIMSSWYRGETIKIINILDIKDKYNFSSLIVKDSFLNNLYLLKYIPKFRRKQKDKMTFFLLCLIGVY